MNYQTANLILDRVVDGESYPLNIVNKALEMTGDLNGLHEGIIPFISGAGMWLSSDNIKYIIDNQWSLDWYLPDDVAIGKLLINSKKGILNRYNLVTDNEVIDKNTLLNDIIDNNHYHIRIKSDTNIEIDINYMNKFTEIMYTL
jgi:hypothetical protein